MYKGNDATLLRSDLEGGGLLSFLTKKNYLRQAELPIVFVIQAASAPVRVS